MKERTGCVHVRPIGLGEAAIAYERCLRDLYGGAVHVVGADQSAESIAVALGDGLPLAFHSSGTTGRTTCAVFEPATRVRHISAVLDSLGLTDELQWCALPAPGYAYGLSIVETHAAAGIDVQFLRGPDAPSRLARLAADDHRPLGVYVTPQLLPVLLTAGLGPASVGRVVVAGGRLSAGAARVLAARFPGLVLTNMYGQAELGPRISRWHGPASEFVEGDVGTPLAGVTVTVAAVDAKTPPSAANPGRILVTSELAAAAIIRDPALGPQPVPRPLDTGDRGWFDEAGHLRHAGRSGHVLNVAGTRVDVEVLRRTIESDLAPIAVRISHRPARVAGDVVPIVEIVDAPERPLTGSAVRRALHERIGPLAALCDIRIVEQLSVGESGK